ncbi:MAG: homoserine dehydrogenase [Thermoplasmataceae archaeon]
MKNNFPEYRIALMGLGNVARSFLYVLDKNFKTISRKTGKNLKIVYASDSKGVYNKPDGFKPIDLLEAKQKGRMDLVGKKISTEDLFSGAPDVVVDLTPATPDGIFGLDLYKRSFGSGADVVTANKSPLAMQWSDVMNAARINGRRIRYEATVAGGTPLFNLLDYSMMPVEVIRIRGIVSMTVNFVLDRLLHNLDFSQSVKMAQKEGIAETDFHDDTMGIDSARKTVIIANAVFGSNLSLRDIKYDGVETLSDRIGEMRRSGDRYRIVSDVYRKDNEVFASSLINSIEPLDPLVSLGTSSLSYLLETTEGSKYFIGNIRDGPLETASAVLNDVMILAREEI